MLVIQVGNAYVLFSSDEYRGDMTGLWVCCSKGKVVHLLKMLSENVEENLSFDIDVLDPKEAPATGIHPVSLRRYTVVIQHLPHNNPAPLQDQCGILCKNLL